MPRATATLCAGVGAYIFGSWAITRIYPNIRHYRTRRPKLSKITYHYTTAPSHFPRDCTTPPLNMPREDVKVNSIAMAKSHGKSLILIS
jgi:hypothetical protein